MGKSVAKIAEPTQYVPLVGETLIENLGPRSRHQRVLEGLSPLIRQSLGVPVVLVSLVRERRTRQFFRLRSSGSGRWLEGIGQTTPGSFSATVIDTDRPLIIEAVSRGMRVCGDLSVDDLGAGAYLGVPIHTGEGRTSGVLAAIDLEPRTWTMRDVATLTDLSIRLSDLLHLEEAPGAEPSEAA